MADNVGIHCYSKVQVRKSISDTAIDVYKAPSKTPRGVCAQEIKYVTSTLS